MISTSEIIHITRSFTLHNHPSGIIKPSPEDIHITKLITDIAKQLDIKVHDHIIIGGSQFYSFLEEGTMPE